MSEKSSFAPARLSYKGLFGGFLCLCLFFYATGLLAQQAGDDPKAQEILAFIDDLWRSRSSHGVIAMQVKTRNYTRTLTMESWSKGKEKSLVRILSPLKEKGTMSLKSENNLYTYLPKTDRTIRLTSSMMLGSWMGSHFTNDDLVKESRLADDYHARIAFEGMRDGQDILEFSLTPRAEAPVVWGKIVIAVRADDYLPLASLYYDEDLVLARTLTFVDIREMGGRKLPRVLKMVPADKPDEFTEIVYEEIRFDVDLDDSFFSLGQLRRR
jgi:outer membrane lipoprotein-sorting protein